MVRGYLRAVHVEARDHRDHVLEPQRRRGPQAAAGARRAGRGEAAGAVGPEVSRGPAQRGSASQDPHHVHRPRRGRLCGPLRSVVQVSRRLKRTSLT